ncbi:hypothetical protein EV363DRAFT_1454460 [Boletus edulis]|nr:hypothetical protein EV363DRAFT_1454460 [Boletus edulis]
MSLPPPLLPTLTPSLLRPSPSPWQAPPIILSPLPLSGNKAFANMDENPYESRILLHGRARNISGEELEQQSGSNSSPTINSKPILFLPFPALIALLLETLRRASFASPLVLEHLQDFVYFAYTFYTGLLEEPSLKSFCAGWLEALATPSTGKLHYHLGLLSCEVETEELRAVYHFVKKYDRSPFVHDIVGIIQDKDADKCGNELKNDTAWRWIRIMHTAVNLAGLVDGFTWIEGMCEWKVDGMLEANLSDKALCQFPNFQEYIPERALLLIAAIVRFVLEIFAAHGFNKRVSINMEQVEGYYNNLCQLLNQVVADEYHRPKLDNMRHQWVKIGMTTYLAGSEFLIVLLAIALVHSDPTLLLGCLYISVLISKTVSKPENPEPQRLKRPNLTILL